MPTTSYEDKVRREQEWYRQSGFQSRHFLNSWPFYNPKREVISVHFCWTQIARYIREVLDRDGLSDPRMLIAPTGAGNDLPYLQPLSRRITGIDISTEALEKIKGPGIEKHLGDIKHMTMFADGQFDIVIMSAFFHHYVKFGFDEYLLEARRVLRPGGWLFCCEPSIMHPLCFAALCGKRLFGNITGCVEDETPFCPVRLTRAMKRCAFRDVTITAASYSHNRMPVPLARILNALTHPLRGALVLRYFAWVQLYQGRKP